MTRIVKIKPVIGWREWVSFPELGVQQVKAKIDTGARTSALHAYNVKCYKTKSGIDKVRFDVHPVQHNDRKIIEARAELIDTRRIRSSNGQIETRYVIETFLQMGEFIYPIELTLTNRDEMGYRLLLGRTALKKFVIDSNKSYLLGKTK